MQSIDRFDKAILDIVQSDNRVTSDALGRRVGLSATACQRRLKRLRESGIIAADVAIVSPQAAGNRLTFVVEVMLERERPELLAAFRKAMLGEDAVMQCYFVTGSADFILIVTVADMPEFNDFSQRALLAAPNVKAIRTSVVLDRVKFGMRVPFGD
jgi:Lrp/AsnC family transcriptional regulator, leucine-responsive regulatory protein